MNQPATLGHNNPPDPVEVLRSNLVAATVETRAEIERLELEAAKITTIGDDIAAAKATDLIKEIQTLAKTYEKAQKEEKAPHLALANAAFDFFKPGLNSLELSKARVNRPLTLFAQAKAEQERAAARAEAARLQAIAEEEARKARELEKVGLNEHAQVQLHQAMKTEAAAIKVANQTTAQLSTVRSATAISGLRTRWVATITDKNALDLEKLRPYLKPEVLQVALNAFMANGGRQITGATILEESSINVR